MKKVFLLAAIALAGVCGTARAQSGTSQTHTKGLFIDMWVQLGIGNKFHPFDVQLAPGWAFNRTLFGRVQIGGETALWNVGGIKTWSENLTLGPALGVNVWRSKRTDNRLAVVGAFGHSLLKKETWRYNSYDLGLELADRRFLVGAGVRHYDSLGGGGLAIVDPAIGGIDLNRTSFYVKIGWTIGD